MAGAALGWINTRRQTGAANLAQRQPGVLGLPLLRSWPPLEAGLSQGQQEPVEVRQPFSHGNGLTPTQPGASGRPPTGRQRYRTVRLKTPPGGDKCKPAAGCEFEAEGGTRQIPRLKALAQIREQGVASEYHVKLGPIN